MIVKGVWLVILKPLLKESTMPRVKHDSANAAAKAPTTPSKPAKTAHASQHERAPVGTRPTIYGELKGSHGWLTAEKARAFLGWKQSPDSSKPFTDYLLKDRRGIPTRCYNIDKQRPLYAAVANQWMGEILGGHWNGDGGDTNGESIIIGRTGLVIDGKHRLIGLVLAEQEWLKHPDKYPYWQEEPKIHCFINTGVREDTHAINTINTGKPRTLADAVYASGLFGDISAGKAKDRRKVQMLSKMMDHAIRFLWDRTMASETAFAPKRSHAESLDFIQRHPRILECVKHIYEENGDQGKLKYYPSPGYAAALLYLMGSSATDNYLEDDTGYTQVSNPTEDLLDWSMWDKAVEFWHLLAAHDPRMNHVRQAIADLLDSEGGSFRNERIAILIKAWWCWSTGLEITEKAIELDIVTDIEGRPRLTETPRVGEALGEACGIDLGGKG
jgi:hypothetical protein